MSIFIGKKIVGKSFEEVENAVIEALKPEGFGVVTQMNMEKTFKDKLNEDFRPYKILGVCNPKFAFEALKQDDKIGVMLPCNVCIQQLDDSNIEIFAINPNEVMTGFNVEGLETFAQQVTERLTRALDQVG
jgi:uncharacterized protein (DUF302 family)